MTARLKVILSHLRRPDALFSRKVSSTACRANQTGTKLEFIVRPAEEKDLEGILHLAHKEKWHFHTKEKLDILYKITRKDPRGFVVAEQDGKVIGMSVLYQLDTDLYSGGLGLFDDDFRGKGLGKRLLIDPVSDWWDTKNMVGSVLRSSGALKFLMKQATEKQPLLDGGIAQYVCNQVPTSAKEKPCVGNSDVDILSISDIDFGTLLEYDTILHILPRTEYMTLFLNIPNTITKVAVDKNDKQKILGYGAVQQVGNGLHIGPLYADKPDIASDLMLSLLCELPASTSVSVFVPLKNEMAVHMIENIGFKQNPDLIYERVYSKKIIQLPFEKVYAMCDLNVSFF